MLGNILQRCRQFEKAIRYFNQVIKVDAENGFALYGLGNCYRGLRNYTEAVRWWSQVLKNEPDNQSLHTRVGDAYMNLGEFDSAARHYSRSLEIGYDTYALLGMARVSRQKQDMEAAIRYCQQVLDEDADHPRALQEL
ncbi:MAG: tetratricopeptide repeat protein, partial [Gammaproteobacteria bacterium]|nr:tetratricopeptide repeat protein [Gammaproteobacteria bacterium]NIR95098.1 tetratricopeptide repeat protein [Gammaproteobacteria bacterium]NIW47070.1 tetratricopeptide repeat protein [Gammaproteobacteria bacterium]NIX58064.1 tetratricopeptide repeat protein [candidate division Zixibacteria bacterium]